MTSFLLDFANAALTGDRISFWLSVDQLQLAPTVPPVFFILRLWPAEKVFSQESCHRVLFEDCLVGEFAATLCSLSEQTDILSFFESVEPGHAFTFLHNSSVLAQLVAQGFFPLCHETMWQLHEEVHRCSCVFCHIHAFDDFSNFEFSGLPDGLVFISPVSLFGIVDDFVFERERDEAMGRSVSPESFHSAEEEQPVPSEVEELVAEANQILSAFEIDQIFGSTEGVFEAQCDDRGFFEPQIISSVADFLAQTGGQAASFASAIGDIGSAIHRASVRGVSVSEDVFARLDGLTHEMGRFNDSLEAVRRDGVEHKHTHDVPLSRVLQWCFENKETIGIVVLVSIAFILVCKGGSRPIVLSLVAVAGVMVGYHSPKLREIWDRLSPNLTEPLCLFEAQIFDNPLFKSSLLLCYIFGFRGVSVETLTGRFDKFCSVLGEAPKRTSDISATISYYLSSLQDLFNQTLEWCGFEKRLSFGLEKYAESTAILNDVRSLLEKGATCKDLVVEQAARSSQMVQARLQDLLVRKKSEVEFAGDRVLLMRALSKLEAFDRELELRGAGRDVTRLKPRAYLFIGKPGIGKSFLLKSLSFMALYTLLKDDPVALEHVRNGQLRDYIFTRNSCDKFWEGYYNQLLVILDEVGMQKDTAGADAENNEYSNFIKMVNDVVFPLLMANVEKKGSREFNSAIIFGTTNSYQVDIQSITNRDAYDRRWTAFEVSVKPECGKPFQGDNGPSDWLVPDFDKMRGVGYSDEDIALSRFLQFRERSSLLRPGYNGDTIGIDQLMGRITTDLKNRNEEAVSRVKQSEILHAFFNPIVDQPPGSFEPQGSDCPCKVCATYPTLFLGTAERFYFESDLGCLRADQIEKIYQNGFERVKDEDSPLFVQEPLCFSELRRLHPSWNDVQLMFHHGAHAKSKFLRAIDVRGSAIAHEEVMTTGRKVVMILGAFVGVVALWKIGVALFAGGSEGSVEPHCWAESQMLDLNAQDVAKSVIKRNVYSFGDSEVEHRGFLTFVADNIFIVPGHYIDMWRAIWQDKPDTIVHMRRVGDGEGAQVLSFSIRHLLEEVFAPCEGDLAAVYLTGRIVQKHANIERYLMASLARPSGTVVVPVVQRSDLAVSCVEAPFMQKGGVSYSLIGKQRTVDAGIQYRYKTVKGDCGLPIAVCDPFSRSQKIFGIHVAGAPSIGVGVAQAYDLATHTAVLAHFAKVHSLVEAQYKTKSSVVLEMHREGKGWNDLFEVPQSLEIPGKVNLAYLDPPKVPGNTSIVPSPLFKKVGVAPKTKPAYLRPFVDKQGDLVDPNLLATRKYHRTIAALDMDVLDMCKNDVTNCSVNNPMCHDHDQVPREPLSFEVAVAGKEGVEGLDGIPRSTSAGAPRCQSVSLKGKRDFFGSEGPYDFTTSGSREIEESVKDVIGRAKKGVRGNHIFLDFPKDERRPKEKADAGKTRKISACPIDLTIALRMQFGAFVQFWMHNRIVNGCALGVNVYDSQWDAIAQYLGVESKVIAGDFGNYDGSLPYCVMVRFLDTVTDYYGDQGSENERAREVLFQELVNSRHIYPNGAVYEWVGSNASGNPLTTVLNSWCNLVLLRYACLKALGKCNVRDAPRALGQLNRDIRFMTYGDDNLAAVRRGTPCDDLINQRALTRAFAEMGFDYTDESKGAEEVGDDRGIEDVSFLKRKWQRTSLDPRRVFLSPLSLDTIMESIQWTRKRDFDCEAVRDNCCSMLQELSQHSRSIFDEWAPRIVAACRDNMGFVPLPNRYEECQAAIRARDSHL